MVIRRGSRSDGRAHLVMVREMLAEPEVNVPLAPDEFDTNLSRIDELLAPNVLWLVADEDGELAGSLTLRPISTRRALAHVATLGMTVRKQSRRHGIGRALITEALAWAPAAGYSRVELNVYARNAAAIALYEQLGFEHEGRRRRFIREGDAYLDDLIMAKLLG